MNRMGEAQEAARRLVDEGRAYEDEGAIRFRMPDEGVTAWDDIVLGRIEVASEKLDDLVIVRSDGRPTYNFVSPLEDALDGITHVIRGQDHVSNTPKQLRILEALGADLPRYAHVPLLNGPDGRKLSKRHGAITVEDFREQGYIPEAFVNFMALLGWSYDDRTEVMSREELVERFTLERVGKSPGVFDYEKLSHLNGLYLRALPAEEYADRLVAFLRERGYEWDEQVIRRAAPLVQEKIETLGEFPAFAGFFFARVEPDGEVDGQVLPAAAETLAGVEPFEAEPIETALRSLAERLGLKPRDAFQPIRLAVTGSMVSPGLFESLELLGREESLARLGSRRGDASGSSAR
jgi:glutamyl-tRNA synthetase